MDNFKKLIYLSLPVVLSGCFGTPTESELKQLHSKFSIGESGIISLCGVEQGDISSGEKALSSMKERYSAGTIIRSIIADAKNVTADKLPTYPAYPESLDGYFSAPYMSTPAMLTDSNELKRELQADRSRFDYFNDEDYENYIAGIEEVLEIRSKSNLTYQQAVEVFTSWFKVKGVAEAEYSKVMSAAIQKAKQTHAAEFSLSACVYSSPNHKSFLEGFPQSLTDYRVDKSDIYKINEDDSLSENISDTIAEYLGENGYSESDMDVIKESADIFVIGNKSTNELVGYGFVSALPVNDKYSYEVEVSIIGTLNSPLPLLIK